MSAATPARPRPAGTLYTVGERFNHASHSVLTALSSARRRFAAWGTHRHGRPDPVRPVSAAGPGRDRHRRRRDRPDRPLRDRPALAGAGGRADLDRRALDQARLAVRDHLLARLEALGDDGVVALVARDDDGARLDRRVRLDDEDVSALLAGLDGCGGRADRVGLDGPRPRAVHELTGPEAPPVRGGSRL